MMVMPANVLRMASIDRQVELAPAGLFPMATLLRDRLGSVASVEFKAVDALGIGAAGHRNGYSMPRAGLP
jgi:hypothetical protein